MNARFGLLFFFFAKSEHQPRVASIYRVRSGAEMMLRFLFLFILFVVQGFSRSSFAEEGGSNNLIGGKRSCMATCASATAGTGSLALDAIALGSRMRASWIRARGNSSAHPCVVR